jgi:hypothetical protein
VVGVLGAVVADCFAERIVAIISARATSASMQATAEGEKATRMKFCRSLHCEVARNVYAIGKQAS